MSRPRLNILRNLRLQLKTGYLREEPIEYNYMRRYPPLSRDTIPLENRLKDVHIPYVDLYRKAVSKNPLYLDEKVFPAFGAQEPQALILAKRQYQYMQDGLSEEAAYQKALEYVDEVEDAAFHKINEVQSAVQTSTGAKNPFVSNAEVAKTLADWQSKLQTQSYDELTLQEQGELDYFVQTKILGWNEVERERRMKDPVFVLQFEKLMFSLLPQNAEVEARSLKTFQDQFKENFLTLHNYNLNKLTTMQPFYVEDYLHYLSKVQSQPDLSKWEGQEREEFSKWIIDTLAYRDGIENRNAGRIQYYLDAVRDQFFPTLRFPSRAKELTKAFSVKDVKALLYNNEIGYKKENDKLYVKRFYRLPALLFPRDIMCTRISLNEKYLR